MSFSSIPFRFLCLAASVGLAACQGAYAPRVDGGKFLEENMPGPEVEGVEATMEKSAKAAMEKGNYKKAADSYRQLLDRDKDNQTYLLGFAEAERRSGRYDVAERSYDALLQLDQDNIDAKEGLGLTKLAEEEFTEAGNILSEVMKKDAKRWRTLNGLGLLFVQRHMYDEALAYFAEALKYSKNNPSVMNNVGLTQAVQKNYPDATQVLRKASELAPPGSGLRQQIDLNLAMVYGVAGDMKMAEQLASQYLKGPALYNNLGLYSYLAENDVMAKSYLNMALTQSPRYYDTAWKNLKAVGGNAGEKDAKEEFKGKRVKID